MGELEMRKIFHDQAKSKLDELWSRVTSGEAALPELSDPSVEAKIRVCLNTSTKSYRYVLPTQILAKFVDPELDCRVLQATTGGSAAGAFDARSLCHSVIVPFDRSHSKVLGGSTEPYVNNPLRVHSVTMEYAANQRNKAEWETLVEVLQWVEDHPDEAEAVYLTVLDEIGKRLSNTAVEYVVPLRVGLPQLETALAEFLDEPSGGDRFQAVVTALLLQVGETFGMFNRVERSHVNAADASTGQVADLECFDGDSLVLVVEAKDRSLVLKDVKDKVDSLRRRKVCEFIFLATRPSSQDDLEQIEEEIHSQFTSGHNIYEFTFDEFSRPILVLLAEDGRRDFLARVGTTLDDFSDFPHRKAWSDALRKL